jgi:Sulfotransferase domain
VGADAGAGGRVRGVAAAEDRYVSADEDSARWAGHRRFIKTHTPLDGIPLDPRASYIVMGRHPLDMAVSLYHQSNNIDRSRMAELTGRPAPDGPPRPRRPLREWLVRWASSHADPHEEMDSLPGGDVASVGRLGPAW